MPSFGENLSLTEVTHESVRVKRVTQTRTAVAQPERALARCCTARGTGPATCDSSWRPVHRMVFLAAMLPAVGLNAVEGFRPEPAPGSSPSYLANRPWQARGFRRHYYGIWDEVSPLGRWPDCAASYVVCADDRLVDPAWQRRTAREQLGVEPVEIAGDHGPFLARPAELARLLVDLDQGTDCLPLCKTGVLHSGTHVTLA